MTKRMIIYANQKKMRADATRDAFIDTLKIKKKPDTKAKYFSKKSISKKRYV